MAGGIPGMQACLQHGEWRCGGLLRVEVCQADIDQHEALDTTASAQYGDFPGAEGAGAIVIKGQGPVHECSRVM